MGNTCDSFSGNGKRAFYLVMVIFSLIARFIFRKIQINVDTGSKMLEGYRLISISFSYI